MTMFAGKSRLLIAAGGCIVAAAYAYTALGLRTPAFSDPVGPRMVPYMIAAGMIMACVALVIDHFVTQRGRAESVPLPAASKGEDDGVTPIALFALGMLVGYYLLFERLGFIVATAVFLLAFLAYTNRGRWLMNLAVAVLFPIGAYLLLATLLGARLPADILHAG